MTVISSSTITKTDQGMAVTGKLVFASATKLLEQGNQVLKQTNNTEFEIDCHKMQRIDSAGIALLLELHRESVNAKKTCRFVGLSEQAQSLIAAYRLQSIIKAK